MSLLNTFSYTIYGPAILAAAHGCSVYFITYLEKKRKAWHLMIALFSHKCDSCKPQQARNEKYT